MQSTKLIYEALPQSTTVDDQHAIKHPSLKASKRIYRDWAEVINDPPSDSVRVFVDDKDIFDWHVVLSAPSDDHPLSGCKFHFNMKFPDNYPHSPPKISGSQYMPHPNYFGGYICLNMLREVTGQYSGWSSAYSALSILMQLQSFLFASRVDQDYGEARENIITDYAKLNVYKSCMEFVCTKCGFNHTWQAFEPPKNASSVQFSIFAGPGAAYFKKVKDGILKPLEPIKKTNQQLENEKEIKISAFKSDACLMSMPDDVLLHIMSYLVRSEDLAPALNISQRFKEIGVKYAIWTRRELVCFFSKQNYLEEILGIGVTVKREEGKITSFSTYLDLLSKTVFFRDLVRTSAWQECFDLWLPLIINDHHAKRAMPFIKASIVAIVDNVSFYVDNSSYMRKFYDLERSEFRYSSLSTKFHPLMVLRVLPKLMNNTIVSMMQNDSEKPGNFLHHSEKALLGYCSFHHMLLELTRNFPIIQQRVDLVMTHFLRHPSARVKKVVPDLGELLVYLTIASKTSWKSFAPAFLQEIFDRNVKWMVDEGEQGKGHQELLYLEGDPVNEYRLNVTFQSAQTGLRLLMFQVFFLENIGRPSGKSLNDVLKRLNSAFGRPPAGMETVLQKECEKIYSVKTWEEFYARIGITCPSKQELTNLLRQAVLNSARKGYHYSKQLTATLFELRKKKEGNQFGQKYPPMPVPKPSIGKPVTLYVGNLTANVTPRMLETTFRQFGQVSTELYYAYQGGSLGYGSVKVEDEEVVKTIMELMQGYEIDNRPIRIERTKNKPTSAVKPMEYVLAGKPYFPEYKKEEPIPTKPVVSAPTPTTTTTTSSTTSPPAANSTTAPTSSTSSTPSSTSSTSSSSQRNGPRPARRVYIPNAYISREKLIEEKSMAIYNQEQEKRRERERRERERRERERDNNNNNNNNVNNNWNNNNNNISGRNYANNSNNNNNNNSTNSNFTVVKPRKPQKKEEKVVGKNPYSVLKDDSNLQ